MHLLINGEQRAFTNAEQISLEELLHALDITVFRGLAVAVNNYVVPKSQWPSYDLTEGDAVEIIRATQGG